MAENKTIETKELIVKVRFIEDKAKGIAFKSFKYVSDGGKMVDLRFKKDVDLNQFDGMNKFKVVVKEFNDCGDRYEYPRAYAGGIVSVEKIF